MATEPSANTLTRGYTGARPGPTWMVLALAKPGQDKAGYYEAHDKGWDAHLASLESYVAGQS